MTGVSIAGIGITEFGRNPRSVPKMAVHAVRGALADAGAEWSDVHFAAGGSHSGGHADNLLGPLGLTGIPFMNVFNGCATGASALLAASNAIRAGEARLALAVGFDRHARGSFAPRPRDRGLPEWYGDAGLMVTTQFFGMKIQRYLEQHDVDRSVLARVSAKAFRNAEHNPNAWRRTPVRESEIAGSMMVADPLTKYMFCSPGDGAVAVLLCRADDAHRHSSTPVHIRSLTHRTRRPGSFEVFSPAFSPVEGVSVSADAASAAFEAAGIGPGDIDLAQLQDTDSGAEVIHMAEVGLCEHGEQERLIFDGATELTGQIPVNTDGGCLANGEPIGASALRQIHESVLQLRGTAGVRQVRNGPQTALNHVYGAPGLSACTILSR
ncbi:thiolase family protein [Dietzia lutea]|uniref:Acetyl-CoA acetyltransferase n=1 Tax=Dietzia lutea TaxID=546160 RepID=A0A2S1RA00_9ACTN|nr:thiolase family protein [Dietzia lutea]AWH93082.1 acetyl-CoA acetyltransferase [Dietzia lutea]